MKVRCSATIFSKILKKYIYILNFIISKHMPDGWDLYHNHERIEEKLQRDSRRDELIEERQSELSEKNLTVSSENRNVIE